MTRADFREACVERDDGQCLIPGCDEPVDTDPSGPGEVHHIIERKLWQDGGYHPKNGACVCNEHHRLAEDNIIPPQAFWRWTGQTEEVLIPESVAGRPIVTDLRSNGKDIDKWGEQLEYPPWEAFRDYIKYPSTRHLPFSHEREADDTAHDEVTQFVDIPLVITIKMDGGNCMLVKDHEDPIRARNGRHADKEHFDMAKQWYWENGIFEKIPPHLQVFGEWLYAKHSIHYGCDCDESCDDVGPALRDYFQMFGVYDTRYNLWLGWHETCRVAKELGLTLAPPSSIGYRPREFDNRGEAYNILYNVSRQAVEAGHEGIVVRSAHPFHYGQIEQRLGKYVRPGHVEEDEKHWSQRPLVQNQLTTGKFK